MKIKKRFLSLGLIATIVFSSISFSNITLVYAEDGVAINETSFPDATFRSYISTEVDSNNDDKLSNDEISSVTSIALVNRAISDLKGVEYFTALSRLNCSGNKLTSLDVSKNTALEELYCSYNNLTSLDVSNNTALQRLDCSSNNLTSLDVSKNTALGVLDCQNNKLTNLNVSNNTALGVLDCKNNKLTNLDVSKNTTLYGLQCSSNNLTSFDLSMNTELQDLYCDSNNLTSLDVSNNTALDYLQCFNNNLTSLDVSKNTALEELFCSGNYFSKVDVTGLNSLRATDGTIDGTTLFVYAKSSTQDTSTEIASANTPKTPSETASADTPTTPSEIVSQTVTPATVSSISASDVTVARGKTKNISAKVSMSDGSTYTGSVTYKSANTKIATVDQKGNVKGVAGGNTTIIVSAGEKSTKITVTVADIALESTNFALQAGKSTEVEATLTNDSIKSVKSSKTSIAKVSFKKNVIKVKALKKTGTVKIIVTTKQGISKTITVKVQSGKVTTKSIKASTKKVSLAKKGKKATVDITINPISSQDKVKVSLKNSKIAKATYKDGKLTITAKKKGSTTVTVKSGKKSVKITVKVKK